MIYIVTLALAYKAIQQTGLRPKPSSVILATVGTFFYFFFVREITPYLFFMASGNRHPNPAPARLSLKS